LSIFERAAMFAAAALLLAPISKVGETEVGLGVDLLGGALDVETAPGEGAAFTIRLPASEIE
ncbi:MAG: hypothetical protein AAFU55_16630, partial [Pseudomonadota bacterium]